MDINELTIRSSELREELNEMALSPNADAAKLDELRAEWNTVESRCRALLTVRDADARRTGH